MMLAETRGIPIHFELGSHGPKDTGNLKGWSSKIDDFGKIDPSKKVAVVIEMFGEHPEAALTLTTLIDKGMKPSQAFNSIEYFSQFDRLPSDQELARMNFKTNNPFFAQMIQTLDRYALQHPNRLRVLFESSETADFDRAQSQEAENLLNFSMDVATKGYLSYGVNKFDQSAEIEAKINRWRNYALLELFDSLLEEPDINGIVSFLGLTHTNPSVKLQKKQAKVTRNVHNKEDGMYVFPPYSTLIRELESGHIPWEEDKRENHVWKRYIQSMISSYVSLMVDDDFSNTPFSSRPRFLSSLYRLTNHYGRSHGLLFERKIKEHGFEAAIEDWMINPKF